MLFSFPYGVLCSRLCGNKFSTLFPFHRPTVTVNHRNFRIPQGFVFVMNLFFLLNPPPSSATSTPKVHNVSVGGGGSFMYSPDVTYADVGDTIIFNFFPTNHSVVRGEYTDSNACGQGGCNPCVPYDLIHPGERGFNSGNILTQASSGIVRLNTSQWNQKANLCYRLMPLISLSMILRRFGSIARL